MTQGQTKGEWAVEGTKKPNPKDLGIPDGELKTHALSDPDPLRMKTPTFPPLPHTHEAYSLRVFWVCGAKRSGERRD